MKIENLRKKTLTELNELKVIIESVCEDYAKNLTTYATMSADPAFQKMPSDTQKMYNERGKFVQMLETVKTVIKEKLIGIYNE